MTNLKNAIIISHSELLNIYNLLKESVELFHIISITTKDNLNVTLTENLLNAKIDQISKVLYPQTFRED